MTKKAISFQSLFLLCKESVGPLLNINLNDFLYLKYFYNFYRHHVQDKINENDNKLIAFDDKNVCGVYLSQLIRYYIACFFFHNFLESVLLLRRKVLSRVLQFKISLRKLYSRHHENVAYDRISASHLTTDVFKLSLPVHFWSNVSYRV